MNPASSPSSFAADYIGDLATRGRYHFTTREAADALGSSLVSVRASLRRLKRKGHIAAPYRGFHVIVPPEYRHIGCLPADQFVPQLMAHLGLDYYAALLSAARYHGSAHQQPLVFQVIVQKNRPRLTCGKVRVVFVARRNVSEIPTAPFNTPRGRILASSVEATAFDLVGYPAHAGGLDNVATVLAELQGALDPERLVALAPLSPLPWAQRLGYLLSQFEESTGSARLLADYVARRARETVPLDPRGESANAPRDARWKIRVNTSVEPDL